MTTVVMNKKDETIMRLVHYFITEENYNPIVVNGVKDEIWLENNEGPYRIIRINSNNIFNKEQLKFDYFKIESIVKQIKKKTLSFNVNTLNILLDVNEDLEITQDYKNIVDVPLLDNDLNITSKEILEAFPNINDKLLKDTQGVELIMNVTKGINEKNEKDNKLYEKTFKPKKIIITQLLILICFIIFGLEVIIGGPETIISIDPYVLLRLGGNLASKTIGANQIWRLISCAFLHVSLIHLLLNMYSLNILGTQVETFLGKIKFTIIYLVSAITGSLLSCVLSSANVVSAGASGAIFGLMGSLLYFGLQYRTYLGASVRTQILPIIIINLGIGFMPGFGIDNFAHIGGLVGGYLSTMILGVDGKSKLSDKINGTICLLIYIAFTIYMLYFR